ncbi:unnamed protein product [Rotaria sordida]|uniref:Alpha/beta hydrolase fold-3 domain-containing protein n=2 Tax=Rotaria sordida TaxID=392033 RepID=A0A819W5U7_9BILA|nr:unnamed protein product [Rotaria sordida]CAF4119588.1 unnamed protein product [Rotaria sordida]
MAQLLNYGAYDSNYVRDERDFDDPPVCPLHADLRGLPPSFLAIAECDVLADKNRAMAEALCNANVEVEERVYQGATHSFLEVVRIAALSDRALNEATCWLVQQVNREIKDSPSIS